MSLRRLHIRNLAGIFLIIALLLTSFSNCSESFQPTENIIISSQCGEQKTISKSEMFHLVARNHLKLNEKDSIRCPGFFAILKDDRTKSLAVQAKIDSSNNNCNQEFPEDKEPPIPEATPTKDEKIRTLISQARSEYILSWVKQMSDGSHWPTRYHRSSHALTVSDWVAEEFRTMAALRPDIDIRLINHINTPQPSVEVIIHGSDATDKDDYVIVGGHLDSIHQSTSQVTPDSRSPGADDNASGIASLLETFRILMSDGYKPKKTVAFYAYSAEEVGLIGSQEIARSYANADKTVLGVMQIDMSMYSTNSGDTIQFISDYTSNNLTALATSLSQDYLNLNVTYKACGYACSDHASWSSYSYPSFMPTEEEIDTSVNRIHTTSDVVDDKLNPDYAMKFSQLAVAFIISLSYE